MRKFTLLLCGIAFTYFGFAQSPKQTIPLKAISPLQGIDLGNKNILQHPAAPHPIHNNGNSGGNLRDVTYVQIGSAASGLTVLNNAANVVSAYNPLNTVCFTHRNEPGTFGGTSAQ